MLESGCLLLSPLFFQKMRPMHLKTYRPYNIMEWIIYRIKYIYILYIYTLQKIYIAACYNIYVQVYIYILLTNTAQTSPTRWCQDIVQMGRIWNSVLHFEFETREAGERKRISISDGLFKRIILKTIGWIMDESYSNIYWKKWNPPNGGHLTLAKVT